LSEQHCCKNGVRNYFWPHKRSFYFNLGQCLYFSFSTHKQCILSQLYTTVLLCFQKKLVCALAGFEPGSSVPEADAISTTPRRQGRKRSLCVRAQTVFFKHLLSQISNIKCSVEANWVWNVDGMYVCVEICRSPKQCRDSNPRVLFGSCMQCAIWLLSHVCTWSYTAHVPRRLQCFCSYI
jgi:hypothetical protein